MKFSTLLLAAHTASVIGTQPDGSALLQLRKMSVLSANNASVSSRGQFDPFAITYVTPCDKDELANQIEDLETERESKFEILKGKTSELAIREALVKSQQSLVNGIKKVLGEKQTILEGRETLVTQIEDTKAATLANLTSYKDQWSAKADELSAAKTALDSARETEKNKKRAWFMAFMNYKQQTESAAAQTSLVETSKKEVKDAEDALATGEKNANSACATAKDFRAKATAAAAAHDAAVKEWQTRKAQHSEAHRAKEARRSEMSAASQALDAARAARVSAASKRAKECKESADADLSEASAEGKYRAKKKVCAALEAEEQDLIQAQAAAQVAYDAASGEAESTNRAYGLAKKALRVAIAKYEAATAALTDAQDSQKEAVAKETSECAKAESAKSVVSKTTSELHQAGEALVKARFADSQADSALTRATSHESTTCDTASKAQCAMNRAKAALDAAKLLYDEAVAKRKSQDQVVTAKNALVASAKKSVEEAESTVKTAQSSHAESEKTKGATKLAVSNAWKLFRDATFKYGRAVLVQGRAKAAFDTATEQVQCATNRYTSATNDFKLATASKEEKEDAKRICDEDLKNKKNPERAVELMERLQVSYDEVEMALGLWKTTKGKMESLKEELDAKTKYMQAMKADYESKVAYTAKAKALRIKLYAELKKAQAVWNAACKDATAAYEHMVSWQNELEVRVDSYNAAVDVRNKAVQLQQVLVAAEKLAKQNYEDALEFWNQKVADHDSWKGKCAAARTAKEAKEAQKEKTADALASAIALVESLQSRLECETVTWETAKSHCRAAGDDRAEMDAAVVLAEKALSDAEAEKKRAQKAKDTAEAQMKAALKKQSDAKAALDAAIQAVTAKTQESMKCDEEEETLRLAWVKADAKAEQEQKQCAAACAALTAANRAVAAAETAYSTAVTNYENADAMAKQTWNAREDAAAAEAAAEEAATKADELAACKERTCAKKTAEAETLKSELEAAKNNLKTQSDKLTQLQSDVAAAQIVLKKAQDASTKAVQDRGAAEGAVVVAQDALDEIENCIDSLEKKLAYLATDLRQAKDDVADSQDLIAKEEKNVKAAQVVLNHTRPMSLA